MEKGEKIAILSIILNIFLFIIKYIGAVLSGSLGLKAEAFHSLTDVVASVTIFIGLKISNRKSKRFPYGLYKVENLVSFFISIAIFFAAYEIVRDAIRGTALILMKPWIAIVSLLIAIIAAFSFSRYEFKIGKIINSPSLVADSKHIGVDLFAMGIVVVGVISSFFGISIDRYTSLIVAVFICYAGYKILLDSLRVLLDASIDYDTLRMAEDVIRTEPQVVDIINLKGRNSGRFKFIEAEIVLKTHNLDKAHFITSRIEKKIKERIKNVDEILIHYEPIKKDVFLYYLPVEKAINDLDKLKEITISAHFGETNYFLILSVDINNMKVIEAKTIENPFKNLEKKRGIFVAEYLVKNGIDVLITSENFENKGPFYVLSNAGVEIINVKEKRVSEILKELGLRM